MLSWSAGLDSVDVAVQHQLTLITGRAPGDLGCDRGIAVPIGTHPGAEGAERRLGHLDIGVVAMQGVDQPSAQLRHRVKQHLLEVVQVESTSSSTVGLNWWSSSVRHHRRISSSSWSRRMPELMRQRGVGLKLLEQVGDPPLLVPHRVPHDLRGVRGEDQSDVQFPQQLFHLRGGHVHPPQPLETSPKVAGSVWLARGGAKGSKAPRCAASALGLGLRLSR